MWNDFLSSINFDVNSFGRGRVVLIICFSANIFSQPNAHNQFKYDTFECTTLWVVFFAQTEREREREREYNWIYFSLLIQNIVRPSVPHPPPPPSPSRNVKSIEWRWPISTVRTTKRPWPTPWSTSENAPSAVLWTKKPSGSFWVSCPEICGWSAWTSSWSFTRPANRNLRSSRHWSATDARARNSWSPSSKRWANFR